MSRVFVMLTWLLLCSAALAPAMGNQLSDDPLRAEPPVEREAVREATARWWIVGVSKLGASMMERQTVGDRAPKKTAWSQMVYAVPEHGVSNAMMQIRYDCSKRTYLRLRQIDYDDAGRVLRDRIPETAEQSPAPSTFGEAALKNACEPGTTMPGPFPLARDQDEAAKIAAVLVGLGEDGDIAGLMASLNPVEDQEQIRYILKNTIKPANRTESARVIGVSIDEPR